MAAVNPYLNFEGNTEEVFKFYKSVFGGEFDTVMRFGEMPDSVPLPPGTDKNRIMHISLPIGNGTVLMGSDTIEGFGALTYGTNFHIAYSPDNEEQARKVFDGLAAGGKVIMPLETSFWGKLFGMLVDKHGVQWMINL